MLNSCSPSLRCGTSLLTSEMMFLPFLQIGGCQSGWGALTALATMMVFPPSGHAKGSSCHYLLGMVWVLQADKDHFHIHHQPKASPPQLGIPGPRGRVWVGISNILAQAVTSLSDCPMPSCLTRTVGESHWP